MPEPSLRAPAAGRPGPPLTGEPLAPRTPQLPALRHGRRAAFASSVAGGLTHRSRACGLLPQTALVLGSLTTAEVGEHGEVIAGPYLTLGIPTS